MDVDVADVHRVVAVDDRFDHGFFPALETRDRAFDLRAGQQRLVVEADLLVHHAVDPK